MILGVRANRATFRPIRFTTGLNIVLADRSTTASDRDSRNGLGKSTLIDIFHFCLGAKDNFDERALSGWSFTLDIKVLGREVSVTRAVGENRVAIQGDTNGWPQEPDFDGESGKRILTVSEWTAVLGNLWFGLPLEESRTKYTPTFRSLISYFIRRGGDAYVDPFSHFKQRREWDKQVNNAFLLGLTWEKASEWQVLKDKKETLDKLKTATREGAFEELLGTGQLEAEKVRAEQRLEAEKVALAAFRVHPRYREIESQANSLTERIHGELNANVTDKQILTLYERSLAEEREPAATQLSRLYADAGVALPGVALAQLEAVEQFHENLVRNRQTFLHRELQRLREVLAERDLRVARYTEERAVLMETLQTTGALDEYMRMQQAFTKSSIELKELVHKLETQRQFQQGSSVLRVQQEKLKQRTLDDLTDLEAQRKKAIALFNANSEALYERPGDLLIDVTDNGFKFDIAIERGASTGVGHMTVLCYDLTLAQLWAERQTSPFLLVHDSTIFDGVDERQFAKALKLIRNVTERYGFQYICTMNSDVVPYGELEGFDFETLVKHRLTDDSPEGTLMGIRY